MMRREAGRLIEKPHSRFWFVRVLNPWLPEDDRKHKGHMGSLSSRCQECGVLIDYCDFKSAIAEGEVTQPGCFEINTQSRHVAYCIYPDGTSSLNRYCRNLAGSLIHQSGVLKLGQQNLNTRSSYADIPDSSAHHRIRSRPKHVFRRGLYRREVMPCHSRHKLHRRGIQSLQLR